MWKDIKAVVKGLIHVQHFYDAERRITSEIIWLRNEMNSLINQMVFRGEAQQQLTSKIDHLERRISELERDKQFRTLWLKVAAMFDNKGREIHANPEWLAVIVHNEHIYDYENGLLDYSFDGKTLTLETELTYELTKPSILRLHKALTTH